MGAKYVPGRPCFGCGAGRGLSRSLSGVLLVLSTWGAACGPDPAARGPDLGGRVIRVALLPDALPFSRLNPISGAPEGWDVDVVMELGRRLNFMPEFILCESVELVAGTAAARWDLAGGGVTATAERLATVDFAFVQKLVHQRLIVRAAEARVRTLVEFRRAVALRVGALDGSPNERTAVGFLGRERVRAYAAVEAMVAGLMQNEVDGVVLDEPVCRVVVAQRPDELRHLPGSLGGSPLGFILPRHSELTPLVTLAFSTMVDDGTAGVIDARWGLD